eukprot:5729073-Pyramimonas_sp.AAC.1
MCADQLTKVAGQDSKELYRLISSGYYAITDKVRVRQGMVLDIPIRKYYGQLYLEDICTIFYTTTENVHMDIWYYNSIFMRCEDYSGFTHANAR